MSAVRLDRLFRAYSDPTRLRILALVRCGPVCVGDLVAALRVRQPAASRHLAYLRAAGLVEVERRGLWRFYRLAPASGRFHGRLLACLGSCFGEVPEIASDARRMRRLQAAGGCCPDDMRRAIKRRRR